MSVPAAIAELPPTPCTVCGAPMVATEPQFLHQDPELACRYCGRREPLPRDATERHRHLRLRLLQVAQAREAAEAPLRTFKVMNESWPPAIALVAVMSAYQAFRLSNSWRLLGKLDPAQAVFGLVPLAVSIGMLSGWLGMRHVFSRQLLPILRARPPHAPGLAARCRNCGGNLPAVRAPQVMCRYCSASNLLDATLTANAAALLQQEAREYQNRLQPWARSAALYQAPVRAFYLYGAVGALSGLLLSVLGLFLFAR
jgi:hypothetical protein